MTKKTTDPQILLDADVIRHFLKSDRIFDLPKIFPDRFVILDVVRNELIRSQSLKKTVENFLEFNNIVVLPFPTGKTDILREYAILKKKFGDGESACMAVAKFDKKYIASSNLKDIKHYCNDNAIIYFTTMDLLCIALEKNIFSNQDCNEFIKKVKEKGSKLPCNTIEEFLKKS